MVHGAFITSCIAGLEHHIHLVCCDCEPVTTTMVRMGIWPASPHSPQLAYTFGLLDWVEALMMECQVALKDFCAALYFKCPYVIKKVDACLINLLYIHFTVFI